MLPEVPVRLDIAESLKRDGFNSFAGLKVLFYFALFKWNPIRLDSRAHETVTKTVH